MPVHYELGGVEERLSDLALLDVLTAPAPPVVQKGRYKRRDEELDPLLLAAAASSGPHVTRNHYAHDFFPAVGDPRAEGAWDWSKWQAEDPRCREGRKPRLKYVSRQAPRSQRLKKHEAHKEEQKENGRVADPLGRADNLPATRGTSHPAIGSISASSQNIVEPVSISPGPLLASTSSEVEVKCMARTRVPTPHGPVFLHLYHNNRDNKEHLAIVVDPAQFLEPSSGHAPPIRSRSLDAIWSEAETEADRITRGAYIGRLTATSQIPSSPSQQYPHLTTDSIPAPLIRLHSECFTGETIGSMRCDCGEQLDEAIRRISQPIILPSSSPSEQITIPGRGAVIYLRQEGRGIGLLSKIRAYNLQDLGHDTVTANLLLGHQADERGYEIAGAILRDLGLGSQEGVRLLTNNPDKVQALEREHVRVVERVPMIPRSWRVSQPGVMPHVVGMPGEEPMLRKGATMIGGGAVYGEDLDKYLRTKVLRMGHMLPLLSEESILDEVEGL